MPDHRSDAEEGSEVPASGPDEHLDLALRGRLPCIFCGYDLKGISIRGVCPECGSAVRATILYTVDPKADEFQPLRRPWLAGHALVVWAAGGLISALAAWWPRIADVLDGFMSSRPTSVMADWLCVAGAGVSGVAILGFLTSNSTTPLGKRLQGFLALLAYAPLVAGLWWIRFRIDPVNAEPYLGDIALAQRSWVALMVQVALLAALLGVRPIAREFVQRSKAMRTGSVGRQTLLAMVVVVLVAMVATLTRLAAHRLMATSEDLAKGVDGIAQLLTALAWLLFTIGAMTVVRDTNRLRKVILMPPPSLSEVIHGPDDAPSARDS